MSAQGHSLVDEEDTLSHVNAAPVTPNESSPGESLPDNKAEGTGECDICEKINSVLEQTILEDNVSMDIGLFNELLSSECPHHKLLFDWLSKELKFQEFKGILTIYRDYFSSSFHFANKSVEEGLSSFWHQTPYFDVAERPRNQSFGFGFTLDSPWIESDRLLQWYNNCVVDHGEKCSNPEFLTQLPAPEPQLFIDAFDMCLTKAPPGSSYMALSYVWGKVETIKTTKDNLHQLQQPGALEDLMVRHKIPRTIQHALYFVRLLKERYLWVDGLCIVQDDSDKLQDQLDRMASIFANAEAVIIAIDGPNADYGLRGMKNFPAEEPRHVEQLALPFGEKTLLRRHRVGEHGRSSYKKQQYFQRAWTFQEYHFARRRICFEGDSVWFQCCCSTNYEDHGHPELPDVTRDWTFDVGYPALNVYSGLIQDFNRRQLSFPQDCLPAVAGMLSCYTKAFKGGFLCGLPEMFFDAALLWQPGGELERRVPSETNATSTAAEPCLPTWSWAGWHGSIDFDDWASGNDWIAACRGRIAMTPCQTFQITSWYTGADPDTTDKRPIDVEWFAWRDRYKDPDRELPQGWTKRLRMPDTSLTSQHPPDGYGKFLYTHESNNAEFWYPIPLSDPDAQPRLKPNTRYLFGSVQTTQLYTTGAVSTPPAHEGVWMSSRTKCPRISLCNAQNKWAGVLRLHSRDYLAKRGLHPAGAKHALQLIALSRGSIPNTLTAGAVYMEEYYLEQRPRQGEMYEFYNVMWITWEGCVARREAVGRVHRDMWESLQPSVIDVVIG